MVVRARCTVLARRSAEAGARVHHCQHTERDGHSAGHQLQRRIRLLGYGHDRGDGGYEAEGGQEHAATAPSELRFEIDHANDPVSGDRPSR